MVQVQHNSFSYFLLRLLRSFLIYWMHRLVSIASYSANDDLPYDRISMGWLQRLFLDAVVVCCYSAVVSHLYLSIIVIYCILQPSSRIGKCTYMYPGCSRERERQLTNIESVLLSRLNVSNIIKEKKTMCLITSFLGCFISGSGSGESNNFISICFSASSSSE